MATMQWNFKLNNNKEEGVYKACKQGTEVHTEEAVSMIFSNRTIMVTKASFAKLLTSNSKESGLNIV